MTIIKLTGGRGSVMGIVVHGNPNYTVIVLADGRVAKLPTRLIARVETDS